MRFTQDSRTSTHLIRAYGAGKLRINDDVHRATVIVSASVLLTLTEVGDMNDHPRIDPSQLLAHSSELVLIGTRARQIFPPASFSAQCLSADIGFEAMD